MFLRSRFHISIVAILAVQLSVALLARGQTQASCIFKRFALHSPATGVRTLFPGGVNDYATVVGVAEDLDDVVLNQGFTRFSNGGLNFYAARLAGRVVDTFLADRNDNGLTIGVASGGAGGFTPFSLLGSTFTPLTLTIGATRISGISPSKVNNWGTMVGSYPGTSGKIHGFKRFSNGKGITLDFPGAKETFPFGINDSGVIVGFYSATLPPHEIEHGFVYHNGHWATLDYPSSTRHTVLNGIDNAGVIVGGLVAGGFFKGSFIYENGTFKNVSLPNNSTCPTCPADLVGISLRRGLIAGSSGMTGFIATCK
jgi:hypothetical protein